MCFHIVLQISFQISFQILQGINYRTVLGVRSELLPSIVYRLVFSLTDSKMGYVHAFAGSQVRRPVSYSKFTNIVFYLNLRPLQDYLTYIETSKSVGGAKR